MITENSKNILLADDSVFFRTKLSDILIEAGHKISFASDGREVINKVQGDPDSIDLLILDLQMPYVNGFGALEWMKENGYSGRFPILVVTGVYEPGEATNRLKSLGASSMMTKGFTPEQIIHRINQLLFSEKAKERSAPRVPISIPVDFTLGDATSTGYLLNISATGLFLHTSMGILPGLSLLLKFSLPGSDMVFDVRGVVRWSTSSSASKSLLGGAGVMFTSIKDEHKEELKRFVEKEIERFDLLPKTD